MSVVFYSKRALESVSRCLSSAQRKWCDYSIIKLLMFCLPLVTLSACSRAGFPFTATEAAMFEEAPKLFPITNQGKNSPLHPVWFDNERLILNTRNPAVYETNKTPDAKPRVALLNVRTGVWEKTQYQGVLDCFADGNIVVSAYPGQEPYAGAAHPYLGNEYSVYWYGRFGEKLKAMPIEAGVAPKFGSTSCLPAWFEKLDGVRVEPGGKVGEVGTYYLVEPLRAGDGSVKKIYKKYNDTNLYYVEKENGAKVEVKQNIMRDLCYQAYLKRYCFTYDNEFYLINPDWSVVKAPPTKLPIPSSNLSISYAKSGRFLAYTHMPDSWLRQGVYFQSMNGSYRIDDERILDVAGVSPNGCRYAYTRSPSGQSSWKPDSFNNPIHHHEIIELITIELCQGEKK